MLPATLLLSQEVVKVGLDNPLLLKQDCHGSCIPLTRNSRKFQLSFITVPVVSRLLPISM